MNSPFLNRPLYPLLAVLMAVMPSSGFAQQAPAQPPGVPIPGPSGNIPPGAGRIARPGGAAGAGAGGAVTVDGPIEAPPSTMDLMKGGMLMPNASIIKVILPTYQQLTGKRVILDTNIADNNVRVVVNGPISKEDLVDFIERTLLLNGFAFVPTNKENTVKLINVSGGLPLRAQGGKQLYTKDTPLPETDQVVTYFMQLDYIKPEEAVRVFSQIVQLNSYGAIAAVPNASAIVIYEDVAILRQLISLKDVVDVSTGQIKSRWFALERADAEKAAEFLQEVLETEEDSAVAKATRETGGTPPPTNPNPGGDAAATAAGGVAPGGAGQVAVGGDGPKIKIVADIRRNSILAVARPLDLTYIESLLKDYDSASEARTFEKFSLKFMTATKLMPLVSDALSREAGEESQGGSSDSGSQNRSTNASSRSSGSSSRSSSNSGFGSSGSNSGFGGSGSGSGSSSSSSGLDAPDAPPTAESVVIGKTLLVADNERNTIIVSGPPESIRLVEKLIEQLDMRPRQVLLSTVIGQITLGSEKEIGVNAIRAIEKLNNREEVLLGGVLHSNNFPTTDDGLVDFASLTDPTRFPLVDGLNIYGKLAGNLALNIKLLENNNRFKVLQRPSIFTANNQKAVIQSGQRIAVPTNSFQSGAVSGASQSTNIEYRDVVLKLEVVPLINSENEVTLKIFQLNDNVVGTQTIDGNELPIIGTQELETTVTVSNGQTVVLGGLITERSERSINGVPVLIQIPILKHIFGTTNDETRREELLVFIQPTILDTAEQTVSANVGELGRMQGGNDVMEFAMPGYEPVPEIAVPGVPPDQLAGPTEQAEKTKADNKSRQRKVNLFRHR